MMLTSASFNLLGTLSLICDKRFRDRWGSSCCYTSHWQLPCRRCVLPLQAAVLGFVGSPWTLATYVIEGSSSGLYKTIKTMTQSNPEVLSALLQHLAEQIATYSCYQIQSGAQCIQLFDSWGGQLPPQVRQQDIVLQLYAGIVSHHGGSVVVQCLKCMHVSGLIALSLGMYLLDGMCQAHCKWATSCLLEELTTG